MVVDNTDLVPDSNRANNTGASQSLVSVNLNSLVLGSTTDAAIADGQDLYYRLDVPAGNDVLITGNFNESSQAQIYVRQGALPDTENYDESSDNPADLQQTLAILDSKPGTYYVLVNGLQGAGNGLAFTIEVRELGFEILDVAPDHGTTLSSQFPLTLTGSHFTSTTTASLSLAGGSPIPATSVEFQNSNTLVGNFRSDGVLRGYL